MAVNAARHRTGVGSGLRPRILAIGSLLICVLVGSAVYDAWRLHEQLQVSNQRALANLSRALANEAKRNFQSVDLLLKDSADWYEEADGRLDAVDIRKELSARAAGLPQVGVLTVVDSKGQQRYRSRDTGQPLADVSDRPYFISQRNAGGDGRLFINEPIITRTQLLPSVVMSRRIERPGGRFGGVVTATVTLDEFQDIYSSLELNEGSVLALALNDGTLVVRQPSMVAGRNPMGERFPELVGYRDGPAIDRGISPFDGRMKLIAALPVGDLPLTFAVIRDEQMALQPWHDEILSATIRTALLVLLVIATIHGLLKQLRTIAHSEDALRASEGRYAMAMEAADGGHAEWNIGDNSTFLSHRWRTLHGVERLDENAQVREVVAAVHVHPDDRAAIQDAIATHLAGRSEAMEVEYRVRHGEQWRWVHARAKSLLDVTGAPTRVFGAATDVTPRKDALAGKLELERRLQQAQRLESLGTLAGGIAHDFNNILGAILGFGEMAQQQSLPDSAQHRQLARVLQAGERARLLVRRILDFSRSGVIDRMPVHLQPVVEEVIAMLAPTLSRDVELRCALQAPTATVRGDATQLYQVVMNLCTNAVQALGVTGVVTVRLRTVAVPHGKSLFLGGVRPGEYACLEVADTGSGMEPAVLQQIFNPFYTTRKGMDGTGLGLSVVHGVVADHGGAIDVDTAVGAGTTISVWLPTDEVVIAEAAISPEPEELPTGQGQTVMVVDDEVALVELAEDRLAGLGYEPVGFYDAETALRAFEAEPDRFDLLLTDEMLPAMPGSELSARVRALRPGLPVVLMTGRVNQEVEALVKQAGIHALLQKPLRRQDVAYAMASALGSIAPRSN